MIRTNHDSELFWNAEDKSRTRRVAIVLAFVIALITYLGWPRAAAAAIGEREARNHIGGVTNMVVKARGVTKKARPQKSARRASRSVSLAGLVPPVAAKARSMLAACPGSVIVSTVAGRGNRSFHPGGRAFDIKGPNPDCLWRQVVNWNGGVSTDYWSVRCPPRWQLCPHYHVDNGPRLRFAHRDPFRSRRFAMAGAE